MTTPENLWPKQDLIT